MNTYKLTLLDAAWTRYAACDKAEKLAAHQHGRDSHQFREARAELRRTSEEIDALDGCQYTRARLIQRDGGHPEL